MILLLIFFLLAFLVLLLCFLGITLNVYLYRHRALPRLKDEW
jgi:hypothetical protein